jgi:SNF2 family DNA or RNA helicase
LHGPKKDAALQQDAEIYLINHEGLEWLHDNWPAQWDRETLYLINDESTRFKHHDTLRFKIMRGGRVARKDAEGNITRKHFTALLKKFKYRLDLTGTPESREYMGLWSQIYMLDDGKRLGQFISHYRDRFYFPDVFGYDWILKEGGAETIRQSIEDIVLYIDDEKNLDLPRLVGDVVGVSSKSERADPIYIDLPAPAMRKYKELEKTFITELEAGTVSGKNAAVITTKLRQIANGGVYIYPDLSAMEDPAQADRIRQVEHLHHVKAEATLSIIEDLHGDPALITYEYHHDLERLRKVLGKKTPHLGHGVPPTEAARIIDAWNAGDLRALLVQPQSAAHGLNIQHGGRALIWHSLTWSYENYYQLVKRLWRQGQEQRVHLYHLIARGTIDEAVLGSLRAGASTERDFLQALKNYYFN